LGYCHIRHDYRQFRTDRMLLISRTQLPFTLEHGTIDEHREKEKAIEKTKVIILVDKTVARYISGDKKHHGFISEKMKGNHVEMIFMTTDIENGFSRWYLMFCDYAKIIEPERLKVRVKEILRKGELKLMD